VEFAAKYSRQCKTRAPFAQLGYLADALLTAYNSFCSRSLPCYTSHPYCQQCIGMYIATRIDEGVAAMPCPHPGCHTAIDETVMRRLVRSGWLADSKITRLRELRNVDRAARLRSIISGNDAFARWARTNTQSCPHCLAVIQRNTGCSHMTCTCGGEFCYHCGAAYPINSVSDHDAHTSIPHGSNDPPCLSNQGLEIIRIPEIETQPDVDMVSTPITDSARDLVDIASEPVLHTKEAVRERIVAMLTLRCPNMSCQQAIHMDSSFDACFSLRCAQCPTQFCAWCLRCADGDEDPHTHVLDCPQAPEDMQGSALYLHDPPHVPPHPQRKFEEHWREMHRGRASKIVACLPEEEGKSLLADIFGLPLSEGQRVASELQH
jgi:hypothetical protein